LKTVFESGRRQNKQRNFPTPFPPSGREGVALPPPQSHFVRISRGCPRLRTPSKANCRPFPLSGTPTSPPIYRDDHHPREQSWDLGGIGGDQRVKCKVSCQMSPICLPFKECGVSKAPQALAASFRSPSRLDNFLLFVPLQRREGKDTRSRAFSSWNRVVPHPKRAGMS